MNDGIITIMTDLVPLLDKYGARSLHLAINFAEDYYAPQKGAIVINDIALTREQFNHLRETYGTAPNYAPISTIKLFREYTSSSLKEAKDAVEALVIKYVWKD